MKYETANGLCVRLPAGAAVNIARCVPELAGVKQREHGGSGLGLSSVHDAAALYGGTVTVDGEEPHGARFTEPFPRAKADNAPEVQKEVPES